MKRSLKKVFGIILSAVISISGLTKALAYDQNINIVKNNVVFNYIDDQNQGDYLSLKGELNNSSAVVYHQDVEITKETFDAIRTKEQEAIDAAKVDGNSEKVLSLQNELAALVTGYNDNNWEQLTLKESTDTEQRYNVKAPTNYSYFISWVKVTLNGQDYYSYFLACLNEVEQKICKIENGVYYDKTGAQVSKEEYETSCGTKKICRIESGKYYDKNGNEVTKDAYYKSCPNPKTGVNMYYVYGIATVAIAFVLYMATRKVRKFEN